MLKKICYNAWFPLLCLFVLGTSDIHDNLKYVIGEGEVILIDLSLLLFSLIVAFLQFQKKKSEYFILVSPLFLLMLFLVLWYSFLPEQKLIRAQDRYSNFENINYSSIEKDELYSLRVKYIQCEQKARKLELEAAELRYTGPSEYYGVQTLQNIEFFSMIGLIALYLLCWYIYLSKSSKNALSHSPPN